MLDCGHRKIIRGQTQLFQPAAGSQYHGITRLHGEVGELMIASDILLRQEPHMGQFSIPVRPS